MDGQKLVDMLQRTIHPDTRESAEQELNQVHKIIGFAPTLLQVVMSDQLQMPIRQAGVIYLKNMVIQCWNEKEAENVGDPIPYSVHEQDRQAIRDNIIEAMIATPELIRVQLGVCLYQILKSDYPGRWTGVVDKVVNYLNSDNTGAWYGALVAVYQLVKNFEYKKPEERGPLNAAMQHILPIVHQRCEQLLPDASELSVLMQKQILKIFFALVQYNLPLELVTKEMFVGWMKLIKVIVERPVPEETQQVDNDEKPELIWWKCKKWAMHILARVFERYGSPGNVTKEYEQFADWYLKSFSGEILHVLLKNLDQYRQGVFLSSRVLQQTLNYLNTGVSHAISWKFMKPHIGVIVKDILFPLMCYKDEDDELWNEDPYEYIRLKFDVFEDFISPVTAAQTMLHTIVKNRKQMLEMTMGFCREILTTKDIDARKKDGALHMVGTLADILLKKKKYKEQMELLLTLHVFPEFQSELGYMRARANWVLHYFSEINFKDKKNLMQALELSRKCLCEEKEMPVKVEAAIALQMLITNQDNAKEYLQAHVKNIIQELLYVIRETENDDLTNVMQKLICTYGEYIIPIAVEITQHLAMTFNQVIDAEDQTDDKAITAMGILNTIETILTVMEDHKEIMMRIEEIVLGVIGTILQQNVMDFYEEVLSLVFSLTCSHISPHLWQVFFMLYDMFQKDGFDFFLEMMPALHNYIIVDPVAFISDPKHIEVIYNICKRVFKGDAGEDSECHAAKLLEVILLQYKGSIDQVIPSFIELVLERLTREVKTSELRTMCLQVVVAALYYNPVLLLEILEKMRLPNSDQSITEQFLKQWFHDTDCFLGLHDRKICALGLCTLMSLPSRPESVNNFASQFLPALIMIFKGLNRAYESRAQAEEEDSDEEDDDEDEDYEEVLESDEDEIDETSQEYLDMLAKRSGGKMNADDDDEEGYEETALESYNTILDDDNCPIDEYMIFKEVLQGLQVQDPSWYNALTSGITQEQQSEIQEIVKLADQRRALAESKKIQEVGGYQFTQTAVPTAFQFGMPPPQQ
ncbi:importin-7-like [Ptychodera flava]|uniref:importin-7-like n=1 Tax=Ptychodera flava TaxID=63121 RepID=UPI00396A0EB7